MFTTGLRILKFKPKYRIIKHHDGFFIPQKRFLGFFYNDIGNNYCALQLGALFVIKEDFMEKRNKKQEVIAEIDEPPDTDSYLGQ